MDFGEINWIKNVILVMKVVKLVIILTIFQMNKIAIPAFLVIIYIKINALINAPKNLISILKIIYVKAVLKNVDNVMVKKMDIVQFVKWDII